MLSFRKGPVAYLFIHFLNRILLLAYLPFLPLLQGGSYGFLANGAISSFLLGSMAAGVIVGYLGDFYHKRRLFFASILTGGFAFSALGVFMLFKLYLRAPILFFALSFLGGSSNSGADVSGTSWILSSALKNQSRQREIFVNLKYWVGNLAGFFGITLGYVATGRLEVTVFYLIVPILSLIIFSTMEKGENLEKKVLGRGRKDKKGFRVDSWLILLIVATNFFLFLAHQQLTKVFPVFLKETYSYGISLYLVFLYINSLVLIISHYFLFRVKRDIFCFFMPVGMLLLGGGSWYFTVLGIFVYALER